jgi:hypothetical protein
VTVHLITIKCTVTVTTRNHRNRAEAVYSRVTQSSDQDNILGYGWTLPMSYIERLNKTGSQNLYSPNRSGFQMTFK